MPTVAKTSSKLAKLGDLSTYSINSNAAPVDVADSSGAVPTFSATFADGESQEYLAGETLSLQNAAIGKPSGEIVSYRKSANSNRYTVDVESILARLNVDLRAYPLADYAGNTEYPSIPIYCLDYWTQQCGIFYTKVPGDVLLYTSGAGQFGWFAKDYIKPLRTNLIGAVAPSMPIRNGRTWTGFGYDIDGKMSFPTGKYLGTPVPLGTERLVFGADIYLGGTSRTADLTWQLRRYNDAKPAVQISVDSQEGFRLRSADDAGAFGTRITSVQPKGDIYSVYASVSQASATTTRFTLTVFNSAGVLKDSQTVLYASAIKGNLFLTSVKAHGYAGGSGDDLTYGNIFVSRMSADPAKKIEDAKSLTSGTKGANFMVGFSGNAWEHIKQYCAIYHLDIGQVDGKLTIGPRQRDVIVGASLSELTTSIQDREKARNVEVVNQNHTPTGITPKVMWAADSVYQVAVGEVQEFLVQTPHSILEVSQPVCVSGITPYPYTSGAGQYVVTGSDGYIVSPTFWRDQGGSITTETTENEGEIKITIKGPDYDSIRAPYRISEGDAGRPALYVTGIGVLAKPKTMKIGTGKGRAAKDVGVTIDSPFIGNAKLAYNAAVQAAKVYATPDVSVTLSEPTSYDKASTLGTVPAGALVKMNGNVLRVVSATQTPAMFNGTGAQHNTIYQLKRSFSGMTIGQQKAYYAGKTIGQVNIKPIRKAN